MEGGREKIRNYSGGSVSNNENIYKMKEKKEGKEIIFLKK